MIFGQNENTTRRKFRQLPREGSARVLKVKQKNDMFKKKKRSGQGLEKKRKWKRDRCFSVLEKKEMEKVFGTGGFGYNVLKQGRRK